MSDAMREVLESYENRAWTRLRELVPEEVRHLMTATHEEAFKAGYTTGVSEGPTVTEAMRASTMGVLLDSFDQALVNMGLDPNVDELEDGEESSRPDGALWNCVICGRQASDAYPPAGHIALAGYEFELPECQNCAARGDGTMLEWKEQAVRNYAAEHPETKTNMALYSQSKAAARSRHKRSNVETFVVTPEYSGDNPQL